MLNKVILIGRIASEPELKYFKNDITITILRVVTTENIKNRKIKSWHRVILNEKNRSFKKNMLIYVSGKIRTRRWLDREKYNYITEVISEEIKIINEEELNYNQENYIRNNDDEEYKEIGENEIKYNEVKEKDENIENGEYESEGEYRYDEEEEIIEEEE